MKFSGNMIVISGSGGAILGGTIAGAVGAVIGALTGATIGLIAGDDDKPQKGKKISYRFNILRDDDVRISTPEGRSEQAKGKAELIN